MIELNKVYNENCLETMKRMESDFIDLTLTSPPYDNLRDYNGYDYDFESIANELFRITKPGGVVVWVINDAVINGSETGTSFRNALYFKEIGFNIHDTMIYKKNSMPINDNRYYQDFEYMFVFTKGKLKTFNPIYEEKRNNDNRQNRTLHRRKKDGKHKIGTSKKFKYKIKSNIWHYFTGGGSTIDKIAFQHPAIFPEKLARDHIYSWTNKNDIVYDCFAGSGTTLKQAFLLGRQYIGSELSEEYCKIINKRLNAYLNQTKLNF